MSRYVVVRKPAKANDYLDPRPVPQPPLPCVYEPDGPIKTGVIDIDGNDICRVRDQIGFIRT